MTRRNEGKREEKKKRGGGERMSEKVNYSEGGSHAHPLLRCHRYVTSVASSILSYAYAYAPKQSLKHETRSEREKGLKSA